MRTESTDPFSLKTDKHLAELDAWIAATREGEDLDIAEFRKRRDAGRFKDYQKAACPYAYLPLRCGWLRPLKRPELLGVIWDQTFTDDKPPPGLYGVIECLPDTHDGFTRSLRTVSKKEWLDLRRDAFCGCYGSADTLPGVQRFRIHRWEDPASRAAKALMSAGGIQ